MRSNRRMQRNLRLDITEGEVTSKFFLLIGNSDSISGLRC
jgi:hypothetical protein